jgi:hypothetical protein
MEREGTEDDAIAWLFRTRKVYLKGEIPVNIESPSEQIQRTEKKTY